MLSFRRARSHPSRLISQRHLQEMPSWDSILAAMEERQWYKEPWGTPSEGKCLPSTASSAMAAEKDGDGNPLECLMDGKAPCWSRAAHLWAVTEDGNELLPHETTDVHGSPICNSPEPETTQASVNR